MPTSPILDKGPCEIVWKYGESDAVYLGKTLGDVKLTMETAASDINEDQAGNAAVNAVLLAAFTGAGDIGAGGPNAYRAAGGVTVNFQSTLAPSPAEARRAADLVVGGIGYQGAPPSPRQVV